jgi:ADP-ribose pyrophosphatase YjhB (NUDIX family)
MPMSDYVANLRRKVGHDLLEVPTVSVLTFDDRDRVLLVRHGESGMWTTPGGMIDPYETPADAALRETWEEAGIRVELTHVIGVFGGPVCATTYANGDRIAWISTVFGARHVSGELRPDNLETVEARYLDATEVASVPCRPHVRLFLDAARAGAPGAYFQPPTWRPPAGA